MKKYAILLVLLSVCLLSGCGKQIQPTPDAVPLPLPTAPEKEYTPVDPSQLLTPEQAENIALEDAGLREADVVGLHTAYGIENGRQTVEITFREGHIEYEYILDAVSGEILHRDKDV